MNKRQTDDRPAGGLVGWLQGRPASSSPHPAPAPAPPPSSSSSSPTIPALCAACHQRQSSDMSVWDQPLFCCWPETGQGGRTTRSDWPSKFSRRLSLPPSAPLAGCLPFPARRSGPVSIPQRWNFLRANCVASQGPRLGLASCKPVHWPVHEQVPHCTAGVCTAWPSRPARRHRELAAGFAPSSARYGSSNPVLTSARRRAVRREQGAWMATATTTTRNGGKQLSCPGPGTQNSPTRKATPSPPAKHTPPRSHDTSQAGPQEFG